MSRKLHPSRIPVAAAEVDGEEAGAVAAAVAEASAEVVEVGAVVGEVTVKIKAGEIRTTATKATVVTATKATADTEAMVVTTTAVTDLATALDMTTVAGEAMDKADMVEVMGSSRVAMEKQDVEVAVVGEAAVMDIIHTHVKSSLSSIGNLDCPVSSIASSRTPVKSSTKRFL